VWDVATWESPLTLPGHGRSAWSLSFHPDGNRLAVGTEDGTVRVWDVTTGAEQPPLKGHTARVNGVAFDRGGKRLASVSWDQVVKVWDLSTAQETLTLPADGLAFLSPRSFTPDNRQL